MPSRKATPPHSHLGRDVPSHPYRGSSIAKGGIQSAVLDEAKLVGGHVHDVQIHCKEQKRKKSVRCNRLLHLLFKSIAENNCQRSEWAFGPARRSRHGGVRESEKRIRDKELCAIIAQAATPPLSHAQPACACSARKPIWPSSIHFLPSSSSVTRLLPAAKDCIEFSSASSSASSWLGAVILGAVQGL